MAIVIPANVAPGLGAASTTIALQKPHVARYFPEIESCHSGTINLHLAAPLEIQLPDIVTPPIEWHPDHPGHTERFGITKIALELPLESPLQEAWIYTPEQSPHRFNAHIAEILARTLPGLTNDAPCKVHITRPLVMIVI